MSEERSGKDDVEKLKQDLEELIDHRIEYNNGFTNLLRGDYSLFISLIALFLSIYGAEKLRFLTQHYVPSVYLMLSIWLLYAIGSTIGASREQEGVIKLISTNPETIKVVFSWYFKWARPKFYSLGILSLLYIVVHLGLREENLIDFGLGLWALAVIFVVILLLIVEKGAAIFAALLDKVHIEMQSTSEVKRVSLIVTIMRILILPIIVIYLCYIIHEYNLYSFSELIEVILTVLLILISLASLSEYLSMKFMVTEVSNQNYKLSEFRTEIDRIEDTEALKKHKKALLKLTLPKADSFLVFFNYYYLMPTQHTFEVGKEEEESNRD